MISGSHLVKYNLKDHSMNLIPIRTVSYPTSLYSSLNASLERIVIIGHKLKAPNHESDNPNFKYYVSPIVKFSFN